MQNLLLFGFNFLWGGLLIVYRSFSSIDIYCSKCIVNLAFQNPSEFDWTLDKWWVMQCICTISSSLPKMVGGSMLTKCLWRVQPYSYYLFIQLFLYKFSSKTWYSSVLWKLADLVLFISTLGGSILGVKFLDPLAGVIVSGMILKAGLESGYQRYICCSALYLHNAHCFLLCTWVVPLWTLMMNLNSNLNFEEVILLKLLTKLYLAAKICLESWISALVTFCQNFAWLHCLP